MSTSLITSPVNYLNKSHIRLEVQNIYEKRKSNGGVPRQFYSYATRNRALLNALRRSFSHLA